MYYVYYACYAYYVCVKCTHQNTHGEHREHFTFNTRLNCINDDTTFLVNTSSLIIANETFSSVWGGGGNSDLGDGISHTSGGVSSVHFVRRENRPGTRDY